MDRFVSKPLNSSVQELVTPCTDFFRTYGYRCYKRIGVGMTGGVFLCHPHDGTSWKAVKVLSKKKKNGGKENKRCFEKEVAFLSKLRHKHIVEMVGAYECPERYIISMPYYPGGDLKSHLLTLKDNQVSTFFLEITSAVTYLHATRLAHRDIKPENIFITSEGHAVLGDFGLARYVRSDQMQLKERCGTEVYSAPEMLKGRKYSWIDFYKCDMYSLGLVLWCMVMRQDVEDNQTDHMSRLSQQESNPGSYRYIIRHLINPVAKQRWNSNQLTSELWDTWSQKGFDLSLYFADVRVAPEPQLTEDDLPPDEIVDVC